MVINIDGLNINYEKSGHKGKKVLLLHGWGQNTKMMAFIADHLKTKFIVYNIDFPGFGLSDEPPVSWSNEDYVECIHSFCKKLKIVNPIIIGHSFGCRVGLYYAYKYPVYKMVLAGAAGIRAEHDIKWYVKVYTYKLGKLLTKPFKNLSEKLRSNAGSSDYRGASEIMKGTLVKCVNFDITPYLKDIKTETLLVFGSKDEATPLKDGKRMEALMPNAGLAIFENDDHFAYINEAARFLNVLDIFFKED